MASILRMPLLRSSAGSTGPLRRWRPLAPTVPSRCLHAPPLAARIAARPRQLKLRRAGRAHSTATNSSSADAPSTDSSAATYDYIIVGAGSAGCVLAHRLSASGLHSVLLLESGPPDSNLWLHLPVGYYKTTHDPRWDWCFKTEAEPNLNGRILSWPRGRVLGGSSSINGMLHVRGQPEDYDGWATTHACGDGWDYESVLPYFKMSEDQEGGDRALHGAGGPVSVSNPRISLLVVDKFLEACVEVGIGGDGDVDLNGRNPEGAGYCQTTQRDGWRCSTATAYLKAVDHNTANLTVATGCTVRRALITTEATGEKRATGVEYTAAAGGGGATILVARARREVVLSAGAIGSPHLLMLSGVGEASQLEDAGVPLIHELDGVGKNLQDHLQVRSVYLLRPLILSQNPSICQCLWVYLHL